MTPPRAKSTDPAEQEPEQGPRITPPEATPNVHAAITDAMRRIRAVGKWGQNTERNGGYKFKRIDDFMTAAHEALGQAGVHVVPRVLQRITDETHKTSSGNVMRWVDLEVEFSFYGPAGDSVQIVTWGEGRDASDKATNKALTGAMKYALMYGLMVPTDDIQDGDREAPESGIRQGPSDADRLAAEQAAAEQRQAEQIATATATPEQVADLRRDVLMYADTIPTALPRKEQLLATWREAAGKGALGCTVAIPEPWQPFTGGLTECTLHDLIQGAQAVTLPLTGEGASDPVDPWATDPAGAGA